MPPKRLSGFGFTSGLLGLLGRSRGDLANGTPERVLFAVSAKFMRRVDELLTLALAFVAHFVPCHWVRLTDLPIRREVHHG